MAAKLLHSLTDDNPDLQKQIGCMTGFFQLFDGHHVLTGRRINQRRLVSGNSHSLDMDSNKLYSQQKALEKRLNKGLHEKQRVSLEPSKVSFSSSSCSSSSQHDYHIPEPAAFDHISLPESPSRDPFLSQPSSYSQFGRQSLDLQDVVKDSMYREAHGLSVKTASTDEATIRVLKHKDSPRPPALSKSMDFHGSLRVLAKLQELPRLSYESKGDSLISTQKDVRRFSCDGRDINRFYLESRDPLKSTSKLKDQPRLSLDGRESSIHVFNPDTKPTSLFRNSQRGGGNSIERVLEIKPSGSPKRPPGVVAKLMGLEALPNSLLVRDRWMGLSKTNPVEDFDGSFSVSSKKNRSIQFSKAPRNSWKDLASPRCRNPDSVMKPIPNATFPIEPEPWRQLDQTRGSPKPQFKHAKSPPVCTPSSSLPSVYSEIEKRLRDLEFQQSGEDLKALKQILDAMQAKLVLETSKDEQYSKIGTQRCGMGPNQDRRLPSQQKQLNDHMISYTRASESPIVIMKPAKLIKKSGIPASSMIPIGDLPGFHKIQDGEFSDRRTVSCNNQTSKYQNPEISHRDPAVSPTEKKANTKSSRSIKGPKRAQQMPKENSRGSIRGPESVSPRMQQKKLGLQKESQRPKPPCDLNQLRRQPSRQAADSGSPDGKFSAKCPKLQQSDDQLSEISCESRNLSNQGDDSSVQSDSNIMFDSMTDVEVMEQSDVVSGNQGPSTGTGVHLLSSLNHKPVNPRLSEIGSLAELATPAIEHSSPVSVLDVSLDRDGTPSPVKQMTHLFKDARTEKIDSYYEDPKDPAGSFPPNMRSGLNSEMGRKKLQKVDNLVQKLKRLNSSHDEASTDYIASLCENTTPDHRYISEMLLASGLLLQDLSSGLTSFKFHQSGYPINPDLFFVLEQTKGNPLPPNGPSPENVLQEAKLHRKLIFDTVNEVLVGKLSSVMPSPCSRPSKVAVKSLPAQKLLRELCLEIEELKAKNSTCSLRDQNDDLKSLFWEDLMCHQSESWTGFYGELPSVVLGVERLIFRDLIDEILMGEAAKRKRHCRQLLFA